MTQITPTEEYTSKKIIDNFNTYWETHDQGLLEFCLEWTKDDVNDQNDVWSNFFNKNSVKSAYIKAQKNRFWEIKTPTVESVFLNLISRYPCIPILIPVSRLYLFFSPDHKNYSIENSFVYLKNVIYIYNIVSELTKKKALTNIKKQVISITSNVISFTSNSLSRLFPYKFSGVLSEYYMRENYYTMANFIRVYEYSIMDLLGLSENHQTPLVVPLETDLKTWNYYHSLNSELVNKYFSKSLIKSYKTVYSHTAYDVVIEDKWPTPSLSEYHYQFHRKKIFDEQNFRCANPVCKNVEPKPCSFPKCKKCESTKYCSRDCQIAHWPQHKLLCAQDLSKENADILFEGRRIIIGAESDIEQKSNNNEISSEVKSDNTKDCVPQIESSNQNFKSLSEKEI